MPELSCIPLIKTTDGPLFGQPNGTLSGLTNMRLRPGGYAESRGGFDKLKPSGGTSANALTSGGHSSVHQLSTNYGWVRNFDAAAAVGSQYSGNHQHSASHFLFGTGVVNDSVYFGADAPFSRIWINISVAAAWTVTIVYEYWNGTSWTALTTTDTVTFTSASLQVASWTLPTNWAATSVGDSGKGNVYGFWMRIRLSVVTAITTLPSAYSCFLNSRGIRELYAATMSPREGPANGKLARYGRSGTVAEWFSINSAMFSGNESPYRMASYRGRLILVNGKEQKRWDGSQFSDLGLPKLTNTITVAASAGAGMGSGVWRYYAAWSYGQIADGYTAQPIDPKARYGPGEAKYLAEVTTVSGGNERVTLTVVGTVAAGAGALLFYRTDDLTNVPSADRGSFPAFLITSKRVLDGGSLESGATFIDSSRGRVFPPTEAILFNSLPPTQCKYITVYQNRLVLMDDETIYWSDPFLPDSFSGKVTNYISLARSSGGRHMGVVEFADQVVAFTEDQTWGLTNLDLDVPQLYPIHPAVGSVAPDAAVAGDGELIWLWRDGFYSWDGTNRPAQKISSDWDETFGNMSFESHGGSRAIIRNRLYIVRLAAPDLSGAGLGYAFDMDTRQWSTWNPVGFSSTIFPMGTIHAPLGNNDAGVAHGIWGKVDYGTAAGDYSLYLDELTTLDDVTAFICTANMYFPQPPSVLLSPTRVLAYYQSVDGWGTPALSFIPGASVIGSNVGTLNTGTADTAQDYSVIAGTFSASGRGASDIGVQFQVTSVAGGTVGNQRLFGAIVEGNPSKFRRGAV